MTIIATLQRVYIAGLVFLLPVIKSAGQAKFTVFANHTRITLHDYLQVQYTIENAKKIDQFIPPRFKEFKVIRGPEQSSGWSLVNGELKQYSSFSYVLKPLKKGHFFVPAASAKTDVGSVRSNTVPVEVVEASTPHSQLDWPAEEKSSFDEFILRKGETVQDKIKNNLFVRLEVNKTSCYEGEPVIATYKLYTRLKSESKVVKRPSFSGFSAYDMVDPESENAVKENFNGKEYHVYMLRKAQLYPLQTGIIELEPAEVENTVTFVKAEYAEQGYSLSDLLNALSTDRTPEEYTVREKVTLTSKQVNIQVRPLPPANRPISFNGAVGKFSVSAAVSKTGLHRNDVADLNLVIKGKGNLPMLAAPSVNWPDSFEIFEPVVKDQINKYFAPIEGAKIFTIAFSPKKEGDFLIPAVEFSYFDPDSGKYRLAKTDSIRLKVSASLDNPSNVNEIITSPEKNLWNEYPRIKWLMLFLTISIGAFGFYVLQRSRNVKRQEAEMVLLKMQEELLLKQVSETASLDQQLVDPLKKARVALGTGQAREFYRLLEEELQSFLGKKFKLVSARPLNLNSQLSAKGADPVLIHSLDQILTDCELALFTPVGMEQKMMDNFTQAEIVVAELKKLD